MTYSSTGPARISVVPRRSRAAVLLAVALMACGVDDRSPRDGGPGAGEIEPPNVVALAPSLTEIVVAIGAADRLVARTDFDDDPAVVHLPSVGQGLDPSLEALAGSGVDVVLLPTGRDAPALIDRLGDVGIEGLSFSTQTVADIYRSAARLGTLLGRTAEADSVIAAMADGLEEVRRRVSGRDPVSVFYVVWSDPPDEASDPPEPPPMRYR